MKSLLRLLTGRIAYERRARLLAVQMAPSFNIAELANNDGLKAELIAAFLLTGTWPEGFAK